MKMSLEGAKLICLNADDSGQFQTISANGKSFKFGYYMDCDVVLEHPDAMGLQCTIDCDAFGRVTIENRCTDHPITLDGKTLCKMRPLLHNTEICIFGKKYLWQFEGNPHSRGFQMEDINDFTTPSKQMKKNQQASNSEPTRKWRKTFQNRLTIHSFAYCIKPEESPQDDKTNIDENKPLNVHESFNDVDIVPNKGISPTPTNIPDLIDLKTPKVIQGPLGFRNSFLSGCKLSETVITSYSPRETGIRQEKSFAIVQSPLSLSKIKMTDGDACIGPFQQIISPVTTPKVRPSMHLIDLTTPTKIVPPVSLPNRTLLKSTLKKNLPKVTSPRTPQKIRKITDLSATESSESVYSVRSTDDESVILLSDDASNSPSPIVKTPPRARTPQSLMKRAILGSAKKAAITKKLLNTAAQKPTQMLVTPKNPKNAVRFQSQSTPQRKSVGRFPSSTESLSPGKPRKSMITSTPFRRRPEVIPSSSRLSLITNTKSAATGSVKKESRNSLMLKQALATTPTSLDSSQRRKSITYDHSQHKPRKSVSFLQTSGKEQRRNKEADVDMSCQEDETNEIESKNVASSFGKDAIFSPEKEKVQPSLSKQKNNEVRENERLSLSAIGKSVHFSGLKSSLKTDSFQKTSSLEKRSESTAFDATKVQNPLKKRMVPNTSSVVSDVDMLSSNQIHKDTEINEELTSNQIIDRQTPQSSKNGSEAKESKSEISEKYSQDNSDDNDNDFDGLDDVFKTPTAKNLMILSSPKSISLQKMSSNAVELIHSTEFDLSANLDELFQTPQSEYISRRGDSEITCATDVPFKPLSPEEAFDMLVGRPILKKSYTRKTPTTKRELSALIISSDSNFPKTDIVEWIDNVNESFELLEGVQDDEVAISYTSTAIDEFSRDPIMMSSVVGNSNVKKATAALKTPKDELVMSLREVDVEGDNKYNTTLVKDPLETTVHRSLSPNISGIDLLDHTSESIFSETLAVSDESSLKEHEKIMKVSDTDDHEVTMNCIQKQLSQDEKAGREIEEAFKHFAKERRNLEEKRLVSTPQAKKLSISKIAKKVTTGNQLLANESLKSFDNNKKNLESSMSKLHSDLQTATLEHEDTAKAELELELSFENFEEEPEFSEKREAKTPEPIKVASKDHRRTLGSSLVQEVKLDLHAAKAERELELAFENFKQEPEISEKREVKTPEPKKVASKDRRRTLGSSLVQEVKLDLQAAKAERELEVAFENFGEEPEFSEMRKVKTPEPMKITSKNHRRTLGSTLVQEVKLELQAAKAERELELAFEYFEEEPEFSEKREVKTPEPKKLASKDHRRTVGSSLVQEVKLDLQAAKAERELELAFEYFEEEPEFSEKREVKTPEPKKLASKDHRRTVGSSLVQEVKLDLQAAKAERELELAFENFEEEPEFSEMRKVKTPEPMKIASKEYRRTLGSTLVQEVKLDLQAAKAERELELEFENFEEEPEFSEMRKVKTPEPKKMASKDHRRTLGSSLVQKVKLDLQAAKAERELELAFENFEEEPEFSEKREVKTPEPMKITSKDHRRTMGSTSVQEVKLDLQAAKAERELELAFENFEEEPEFSEKREVKTPEPMKITSKDHRRTLGSTLVQEVKLDLQAAKAERELELEFENFEEEPEFSEMRKVKTPEPKKMASKDHRRTLGSSLVQKVKLDLQAAKAERELELAFENFEEEPDFSELREVKTPEPMKIASKDHRRTVGSSLVQEVKLDLQAAKAERELELAFENFEEEPEFSEKREVKTPEPMKITSKDHRRTMGSTSVQEVKLDLQAAKAERELELAFENFEEEPEFSEKREVKTPEPMKITSKDHRRTLGSTLVQEVKLDLQAAKAERELELEFENFEEEPEFSEMRKVKTPEPKKMASKYHRRTLGSSLVQEVKLDLQAAKAERELELAFENFEEEPEFSEKREVKTPEPMKITSKDHRRTMGSTLVQEVKLDLQAAKAERELELAFENFEEEPDFSELREVKTPEPMKIASKDHRRTVGSSLVQEVKLDLQAAKAERELELAFENFEEEPEFSEKREVKTPEPMKITSKDHRRTMGSTLVQEVKLDLQAAKAERELELAFENFEEEPDFSELREVKTPEPMKIASKDHRRTVGSSLVQEVKLDLQAAKAERELELAFENFEEEPEFSEMRKVKTPEPMKITSKDHRRTLGSTLFQEVKLDIQAAKAERELELAFENFEEEPEFSEMREVKTPEPKKLASKDHRRTVGSSLVQEVKLDLQTAKAERELELEFENFEEEPEFSEMRKVKTPEPKKMASKDHRRTLGSSLVQEVKLDLKAAKAERELELAFENFEEEPEFSEKREVKTPEPMKITSKDHRRTLGSTLVQEVKLDLQAAKAERELELEFENFEEEPEFSEMRKVKTPEPKKMASKDHRRTLGSSLVQEVKLDLKAAKAERELELAFENFEEEPEFSEKREVKTPEPMKITSKDHRRTLGSTLVQEVKLDLQAARAERELELAFENFEEEPDFSELREVKTPEPMKIASKDHRRTVGSSLVQEVKLDLQAAKAERELELAFENFEEEPEFSEKREVKTPEPMKITSKDHRRTMGSTLVQEVKLDLQAAKAERELDLAFENFEEEPDFSELREVKTPEPMKIASKDHRRTVGSSLVQEVKLDLQAAKAERELELAFENFEEEPEFSEMRKVKTPEPMKITSKNHRRTLGSTLVQEVKLDLQAAKAERELELAFEYFEEEPEFSEKREVKIPEPKKLASKDHRRTVGSSLVQEVKLDLQSAKAERELELEFENFEEETEFSEMRKVKTPKPIKMASKDHRRNLGSTLVQEVNFDLQTAKDERELELAFENLEEESDTAKNYQNCNDRTTSANDEQNKNSKEYENDEDCKSGATEYNSLQKPKTTCSQIDQSGIEREAKVGDEDVNISESKQFSVISDNTIKSLDKPKLMAAEVDNIMSQFKSQDDCLQKMQKTRPSSIGTVTADKTLVLVSSAILEKATSTSRLDSTDIDSTEDESKQTSAVLRTERKQKKTSKNSEISSKEIKLQHLLEPIVENLEIEANLVNLTRMRRTRQNSIDTVTDNANIPTLYPSKCRVTSNSEDEAIKITSSSLYSTDVDSTEEVSKQASINPRSKRIRKKGSKTPEKSLKKTKTKHPGDSTKSILSLKDEIDEIISLSPLAPHSRLRRRKAQLSVVLLESENKSVAESSFNNLTEISGDELSKKGHQQQIDLGNIAEKSMLLTPTPFNLRGRRPPKSSVPSKAPKDEVQRDNSDESEQNPIAETILEEIKCSIQTEENIIIAEKDDISSSERGCTVEQNKITVNERSKKDEEIDVYNDAGESIPSTPLPLNSRGRRPSKTSQPSKQVVAALKITRKSSVDQDVCVEVVPMPSIPVLSRPQERRAALKLDSDLESANSPRRGGRNKTHKEINTGTESIDRKDEDKNDFKIAAPVQPTHQVRSSKENDTSAGIDIIAPSKTRGRKAAVRLESDLESATPPQRSGRNKTKKEPIIETESIIEDKATKDLEHVALVQFTQFKSVQGNDMLVDVDNIVSPKTLRLAIGTETISESIVSGREADKVIETQPLLETKSEHERDSKAHDPDPNPVVTELKSILLPDSTNHEEKSNNAADLKQLSTPNLPKRGRRGAVNKEPVKLVSPIPVRRNTKKKAVVMSIDCKNDENDTQCEVQNELTDTVAVSDDTSSLSPGECQTRGRKVPIASELRQTIVECATPVRRGGRKRVTQISVESDLESATPPLRSGRNKNKKEPIIETESIIEDKATKDLEHVALVQFTQFKSVQGNDMLVDVDNIVSSKTLRLAIGTETISESIVSGSNISQKREADKVIETQPLLETKSEHERDSKAHDRDLNPVVTELKSILLQDSTNHEEKSNNAADLKQLSTPNLPKRGRRGAVNKEPVKLVSPIPVRRNTKRKAVVMSIECKNDENDTQCEVQNELTDTVAVSDDTASLSPGKCQTRGRKAPIASELRQTVVECATPVRRGGRKRVTQISVADVVGNPLLSSDLEEIVTVPVLPKRQGRKPKQKVLTIESLMPHQKSDTNFIEIVTNKDETTVYQDLVSIKSEPLSAEISPLVSKRSRRKAAIQEDIADTKVQSEMHTTLTREENENLNKSSGKEEYSSSTTGVDAQENTPLNKRIRKPPAKLADFTVSNLVQSIKMEVIDQKSQSSGVNDNSLITSKKSKRSRRKAAIQEDIADTKVQSEMHTTLTREENENLNKSSGKEEYSSSTTGVDAQENTPLNKRIRMPPAKLADFTVSNLVQSIKMEVIDQKSQSSGVNNNSLITSKKRRRPAITKLDNLESSQECLTPVGKRGRRGFVQSANTEETTSSSEGKPKEDLVSNETDSNLMQSIKMNVIDQKSQGSGVNENNLITSKKRGRPEKTKLDNLEPSQECSTPAGKRGRRGFVQNANTEETASSSESKPKEDLISNETVSNLVQSIKMEIIDQKSRGSGVNENNLTTPKKRGRPLKTKLDNLESSQECSTLAGKRGRSGSVQNAGTEETTSSSVSKPKEDLVSNEDGPQEKSIKTRGKGLPKNNLTLENSQTQEADSASAAEPKSKPGRKAGVKAEIFPEKEIISEKRSTRRKALPKNNSPIEISHTEKAETSSASMPNSNRGRKVVVKAKENISEKTSVPQKGTSNNDSTLDDSMQNEEAEPGSPTFSNRKREAAIKEDTSPDKENNFEKPSAIRLNSNTMLEPSQNEDEEKVEKRPTRGRKVVTVESVDKFPDKTESSPGPKKHTRGRKVAKESVDIDFNQETKTNTKKSTRSGKIQDKDKNLLAKRKKIEIETSNDQKETPSKRTRRKPNLLISDEFVT